MRPEVKIALVGTLFLAACGTEAQAMGENGTLVPINTAMPTDIPPTEKSFPYLLNIDKPEPIVTVEADLIADRCVLPFEGAKMDTGLQFAMPILTDKKKQAKDDQGRPIWHLGLDFNGNSPEGGETVVSMCDGVVLYAGPVRNGPQTSETRQNLGNVVAVETTYIDGENQIQKAVIVYAHMDDVSDFTNGTVIHKGERLGLLGRSGNWLTYHLHVQIWKMSAWDIAFNSEDISGNLQKISGFSPDSEYDLGLILEDFIDPKEFLLERLAP